MDPSAWRVKAEFGPDTPTFQVREIGFFDGDNNLIAVWAGTDLVPRQTGAITYLIHHVLSFPRVADGLVIVNAPDDIVFDMAVSTAQSIATLQLEQFRQSERILEIAGAY